MSVLGHDGPIAARAAVAMLFGVAVASAVGVCVRWMYAPACGWTGAAAVFLLRTWATIGRMSASRTESHARREDPTRAATDLFILGASVASLIGVAYLFTAGSTHGSGALIEDLVGIL